MSYRYCRVDNCCWEVKSTRNYYAIYNTYIRSVYLTSIFTSVYILLCASACNERIRVRYNSNNNNLSVFLILVDFFFFCFTLRNVFAAYYNIFASVYNLHVPCTIFITYVITFHYIQYMKCVINNCWREMVCADRTLLECGILCLALSAAEESRALHVQAIANPARPTSFAADRSTSVHVMRSRI